mmetsp:Transcript_12997/g.18699  ORF Transcript_12997/g.18699 Transcript_12997/m.18699 type:complete len:172 (-) Transcript_12997:25-540(-)
MAFHDLTQEQSIPKTTKNILGLGTKFCIATEKPNYKWIKQTQQRLTKQIRLHAHLPPLTEPPPKLYCPSDYDPPKADPYTERHTKMFDGPSEQQQNKNTQLRQEPGTSQDFPHTHRQRSEALSSANSTDSTTSTVKRVSETKTSTDSLSTSDSEDTNGTTSCPSSVKPSNK